MRDLTQGKEWKTILLFGIPILIGNLFQLFYNVADSIVVGRWLGTANLAAVGFGFLIGFVMSAVSFGLSLGSGICISRYFGANRQEKIRPAISTGCVFLFWLGTTATVAGWFLADQLTVWFDVPPDASGFAVTYLRILFLGCIPVFLSTALTNMLRGIGDSTGPVCILIGGVLLNVALDLASVIYTDSGIAGIAFATVSSQLFVCLGTILYLYLRYPEFRPRFPFTEFRIDILKESLTLGVPSMLHQLSICLGFLLLQKLINSFGIDCAAAFAAASKIDAFVQFPTVNLAFALSNFLAQNLAAGKFDRVRRGSVVAFQLGILMAGMVSIVVLLIPESLMRCFSDDPEVLKAGCQYFYIVAGFYVVNGVMQTFNGILLGYGKAFQLMICTMFSLCILQVPAAWLLAGTSLGCAGIWAATPVGWIGGVWIRWMFCRKLLPGILSFGLRLSTLNYRKLSTTRFL